MADTVNIVKLEKEITIMCSECNFLLFRCKNASKIKNAKDHRIVDIKIPGLSGDCLTLLRGTPRLALLFVDCCLTSHYKNAHSD